MEKTRISVVEDLPDIREGLRFLLNQTAEFSCLAAYNSAEAFLDELRPGLLPALVIMDLNLPGMGALPASAKPSAAFPSWHSWFLPCMKTATRYLRPWRPGPAAIC
ncbi:response regulator transcription factor [Hymenobacter sp. BRD67]|uniref:response regulator transcription factor n=1 Tax=Hymenobacter sp. BRD67 TaxID=2675877 RepID=UPI001C26258A|nr:response regulator [Hymenobacter sp. BRD67]